jgi:hypothetical protein
MKSKKCCGKITGLEFQVRRAKARELKARKALVQALKKQHERNKSGGKRAVAASKSKDSQWDDARKDVKEEFEKDLERFKQMLSSGEASEK